MTPSVATARLPIPQVDARDPKTERRYAELAERLIPVATELIARVHDEGRESAGHLLASLSELERHALPVVLAAMVPLDRGVTELLGWVAQPSTPRRDAPRTARPISTGAQALQPCGTHAAFVRHKKNDEPIDEECAQAERVYQREHKRRIREQPNAAIAPGATRTRREAGS